MNIPFEHVRKIFYHSNLLFSIRIIIAVLGSTIVPTLFGDIRAVIPLTLGVIASAITDIDTSPKQRITNLAIVLTCFTIATFSVELLFPHPYLFIIGLVLAGFCFTIIGAWGQRFAVISFGTLLISTYTMLGIGLYHTPLVLSLLMLAGALWYGLIAWIESIVQPIRTTHEYLHNSFLSLRDFLNAKSQLFDPDETDGFVLQTKTLTARNQALIQSMNRSKFSLFNRLRGDQGHRRVRIMLNYYFVAQDIHERAASSHMNYQILSNHLKNSDVLFRIARIMSLQAAACEQVAISIKYRKPYEHNPLFERYFSTLAESIKQCQAPQSIIVALTNIHKNLYEIDQQFKQINQVNYISHDNVHNHLVENEVTTFKEAWVRIRENLTVKSALFRHSVRISLVFAIGYLIVQATHLPHGYWILMTSLFICQPNYATTQKRVFLRVAGTVTGILLGVFFVALFDTLTTRLFAIIVCAWLFFLFRNSRYAFATVFITLLVFFSFSLTGESSLDVAYSRILATLIGCSISWLAVSFLWPDWRYRTLPNLVQAALNDNAAYLNQTHRQYSVGRLDDVAYRSARRDAHDDSADLSALISIMSNEPKVNHQLIDQAFQFLTLNHTLISYISTLGVHRASSLSDAVQKQFDQTCDLMVKALHRHQLNEADYQNHCQALRELLQASETLSAIDYQILQQLQLMLQILPEMIKTADHVIQAA
ncbi:TIGR01666 family membrane protein [Wohlfahrtiimonas chitiniclastica]|uniref:YccS family putative transporter n=1 Tax=Wohlfahrtiimonas chitiniclastica TaxID=400946 RepID=UPI001BD08FC8|nr:YccS family putative transporter [Wohlfahrtiimonas chitiniclastica]MBS7833667.1 TIGR01666 family membrane protein [Wohlfahrtiimonas chitiniclastica]